MNGAMLDIANWNPRGLNDQARKDSVRETLATALCHIACLQETKMSVMLPHEAAYIGGGRLNAFVHRPAVGTRGGILLLWNDSYVSITDTHLGTFSISATVRIIAENLSFRLTTVYGPTTDSLKPAFLDEIKTAMPPNDAPWLILGDFNLIYQAADKNNSNLDLRLMGLFRNALNDCSLTEIHLQNRKYTWSNERNDPTLVRLDRVFCNPAWDMMFDHHTLNALSSSMSDHCPLFLSNLGGPRKPKTFKFENFWTGMPGFKEVVAAAWAEPSTHTQPVHVLNHKLRITGRRLSTWSKGLFSNAKLQLTLGLEIILQLDMAQDVRLLSPAERELRRRLKKKVLALAVLERSRKRQSSRVTKLREGDACTKYFHLRANGRRRRNLISLIATNTGIASTHAAKEQVIFDHFKSFMGRPEARVLDFNWDALGITPRNLAHLGNPFSTEEIKMAIRLMPQDKAPGPDGFTGAFFNSCWSIISEDLMRVVHAFTSGQAHNFHMLNSSMVTLIPKKNGAARMGDYRPISLIHGVAKIITKGLALRLRPEMDSLVSSCQSAFIKTRTIHDNFMYVRGVSRKLHTTKSPALLVKLDIAKAFDSVRWDFLLELLRRLGFPDSTRSWIGRILTSSSSRILLNGIPGPPILHGRGLRQGDPLSPLLFDLAIDPLERLLHLATEANLLSPLPGRYTKLRISLYADDAIIFLRPVREDVQNLGLILHNFGQVAGLCTNVEKSSVAPIRCQDLDLDFILQDFHATRVDFPLQYLGLPLSLGRLRKVDIQHVMDKSANKIAAWQGRFIAMAGRATLVKTTLAAYSTHLLTALKIGKGSIKLLNKRCRSFLWAAKEDVTGGQCKVNWARVCRPKSLGGLGILDTEKYARALRLRWLWHQWNSPHKPWVGLDIPCDAQDRDLFAASTHITLGDGCTAQFWHSAWLDRTPLKHAAPLIYTSSRRKNWTVAQGLHNASWLANIDPHQITVHHLLELANLWNRLQAVTLLPDSPDQITWTLTANGSYSSASAYQAQFFGATDWRPYSTVWTVWAPQKCQFFAWLATQNRLWTADRLATRGWPHEPLCQLCKVLPESAEHMFFRCRYSKRIWDAMASWVGCNDLFKPPPPNPAMGVAELWEIFAKHDGFSPKGLRSATTLVCWEIWKERNARVFNKKSTMPSVLVDKIKDEGRAWIAAGAKHFAQLVP